MNINELQNIIIQGVSANTPALTDYSIGSVNYTLTRGLAGGLLDLYNKLEELDNNFFLPNIQGEYLDNLGKTLNIVRLKGSKAIGYVLATNLESRNVTVNPKTILTNQLTLQQYRVVETASVNIPGFSEERLMVESLADSSEANIKAGTQLMTGQYPNLTFTVGSYRNINGTVTGDIKNGTSVESDIAYRERIIQSLLKNTNNYEDLKNLLLNLGDVNNILFTTIDHGKVKVWIEPKQDITSFRLNAIQNIIDREISIGIAAQAVLLQPRPIDFKVKVYANDINTNQISSLKEYIRIYLKQLQYQQPLIIPELTNYIKLKTNIIAEVLLPQQSMVILEEGQCFTVNNVEVVYNV